MLVKTSSMSLQDELPSKNARGDHDTELSSPLLEHPGILKHRGSSDMRVWLSCTGLLDDLTIH